MLWTDLELIWWPTYHRDTKLVITLWILIVNYCIVIIFSSSKTVCVHINQMFTGQKEFKLDWELMQKIKLLGQDYDLRLSRYSLQLPSTQFCISYAWGEWISICFYPLDDFVYHLYLEKNLEKKIFCLFPLWTNSLHFS